MASNNQASPNGDDQMTNNSVPVQQRPASDLVAFERRPYWVRQSSNIGPYQSSEQDRKDAKKMRRLLANRASAQRSREKKAEYIEKLERATAIMKAKLAYLAPAVAYAAQKRMMLERENHELRARIEFLENLHAMKLDEHEALKVERDLLTFRNMLIQEGL